MRKILFGAAISLFLAPAVALAGSQTYSTAGTYSFSVPSYSTLTVTVWGAGGGGGGYSGGGGGGGGYTSKTYSQGNLTPGASVTVVVGSGGTTDAGGNATAGGGSSFNSTLIGGGGGAGARTGPFGAGGSGSGGSTNTTGSSGTTISYNEDENPIVGGNGGAGANGGAGGSGGTYYVSPVAGTAPGGAGGGGAYGAGAYGAVGKVTITWVDLPAPTCSVSFGSNPLAYGNSTSLTWSSTNAATMYINNIGYVAASGSTSVGPLATTDYSCTATNTSGTGTQSRTLTVTPPSGPSITISATTSSIYVGQSTGIHATFAAGSGDALVNDNIDSPVGTGLGANTNPTAHKYYTFTPSSAGTYTFYARAKTNYFTSWTTYAQTSVTVTSSPSCTVSFSQNPITQGGSATLNWSSSNATTFSIANVGSLTPNTSGSTLVSPSSSTDYTGTASAGGVSNTCTASGSSPAGTLTVSCTPVYTCSGQAIRYTNASCSTSTITTCVLPQFCSSGSAVCLDPTPTFNQTSGHSGHLEVHPDLVPKGETTKLFWNVDNVSSCSVSDGTNVWNGMTNTSGGQTTSAINQRTVFTLTCIKIDTSTLIETAVATPVPVFEEK